MNDYREYDQSEEVEAKEFAQQLRKKEKSRNKVMLLTAVAVGAVILLIIFLLLNYLLWDVRNVSVSGCTVVDVEQVISIAEQYRGKPLLFVNSNVIREECLLLSHSFSDISIEKRFPNTLVVNVSEEEPLFYGSYPVEEGRVLYFLTAKSMKVLSISDSKEELLAGYSEVTALKLPEIAYCVVGEKIRFVDETNGKVLPDVIEMIKNSGFGRELAYIDFSSRFNICFFGGIRADGIDAPRYEVRLGSRKELAKKLTFAGGILEELASDFVGIISVEDPDSGYADPE